RHGDRVSAKVEDSHQCGHGPTGSRDAGRECQPEFGIALQQHQAAEARCFPTRADSWQSELERGLRAHRRTGCSAYTPRRPRRELNRITNSHKKAHKTQKLPLCLLCLFVAIRILGYALLMTTKLISSTASAKFRTSVLIPSKICRARLCFNSRTFRSSRSGKYCSLSFICSESPTL